MNQHRTRPDAPRSTLRHVIPNHGRADPRTKAQLDVNRFDVAPKGLAQAFAQRARCIAEVEGLDERAVEVYVRFVKSCNNNMRSILLRI